MFLYTVNISRIHVVNRIVHNTRIHFISHTWSDSSSMQLSYSIRYVAVLSWQMEEYSKHREHRNYLEESHHAAHYIADDFGMVSAKTKQELVRRAADSMWIPVNYDLPADPKHPTVASPTSVKRASDVGKTPRSRWKNSNVTDSE